MEKEKRSITPEQVEKLTSIVAKSIPSDLNFEWAQYWITNPGELETKLRKIFDRTIDCRELLADWEKFYLDVFDIKKDFSKLQVPDQREGFDRLIVVAQGMTPKVVFNKVKSLIAVRLIDIEVEKLKDLVSDRISVKGDYAVWVRDLVNADEENNKLELKSQESERDLRRKGIAIITLEERLLYELMYFRETGKHLDVHGVTICLGSTLHSNDTLKVYFQVAILHVQLEYYGNLGGSAYWPREVVPA